MSWRSWQGWRPLSVRLAVLGALGAAAVGLAAEGPGSASATPWRLGRPDADAVGAVALAAVALGALLLVLGLLAQREEQVAPRRRGSWVGLVLVLAALALAVLVDPPSGRDPGEPPVTEPPATSSPGPSGGLPDAAGAPGLVLLVLGACAATALLASRRRRPPAPAAPAPAAEPLEAALVAAAGSLRSSAGDDPRDRIIGAYAAFEQALDARGLARTPASTPDRLLATSLAHGLPAEPADRLTRLFTTARFATTRLTADDVTAAERALDALLADR